MIVHMDNVPDVLKTLDRELNTIGPANLDIISTSISTLVYNRDLQSWVFAPTIPTAQQQIGYPVELG